MSDGVTITHGGALAVDTEALRGIGMRVRLAAGSLGEARAAVGRSVQAAGALPGGSPFALAAIRASIEGHRALALQTARDIDVMVDLYEMVELRAQLLFLAVGPQQAALQQEIDARDAADPLLGILADRLIERWADGRFDGLFPEDPFSALSLPLLPVPFLTGLFSGALRGLAAGAVQAQLGVVPAVARLQGRADPVRIVAVAVSSPSRAPTGILDSMKRLPSADGAQIAVEKYTMADGSAQFVLYVDGTQSALFGGENPWDMKSNLDLYENRMSESYQATLDALAAAGAEPGDAVHLWGYSQGGMIVSRLAMEGGYDVRTMITAGSPIEPTLPDDVLSVQLRHTDDPVSALAAGGSPAGTGSADSFVALRTVDPQQSLSDLWLHAHLNAQYQETARLVDASGDVRLQALDAVWAELDQAVTISSTQYRAERLD